METTSPDEVVYQLKMFTIVVSKNGIMIKANSGNVKVTNLDHLKFTNYGEN